MEFDVSKLKLENHLTQATENESKGSGSTRVMAMAQLILHCVKGKVFPLQARCGPEGE